MLDILETMRTAAGLEDLDQALGDIFQAEGFRFSCYGNLLQGRTLKDAIRSSRMPGGWWGFYKDEGFMTIDPVWQALPWTSGFFPWDDLVAEGRAGVCLEEARAADLTHGMSIGFRRPGEFYALSVSGRPDEAPFEVRLVLGAAAQFYQHRRRILEGDTPNLHGLSPTQREFLFWSATGLTSDQIATMHGVTSRHVRDVISEAVRRLGCDSRTEAAALGAAKGVLCPQVFKPAVQSAALADPVQ